MLQKLLLLLLLLLQRGDVKLAAAEAVLSLLKVGANLHRFSFLIPAALSLAVEAKDPAVQLAVR